MPASYQCAAADSLCLLLQGFASGDLEKDATAVRMFTDAGVELLLSQASIQCNHNTFAQVLQSD